MHFCIIIYILVIGGGIAGVSCAEMLYMLDTEANITLGKVYFWKLYKCVFYHLFRFEKNDKYEFKAKNSCYEG